MTNAREVVQLTETLKQKLKLKAQRIRRYERRKPSIVRMRSLEKKIIVQKPWREEYRDQKTSLYGRNRDLTGRHYGEKKHSEMKEQYV